MSEQIKQIAERIRTLREISGISAEILAKKCNVSPDQYQQYENAETDIPIGFLNNLAGLLGVELGELLTGNSPKLHHYSLVRNGKGVTVERRKPYAYKSLAYNFSHKKAEPFLVTIEPGILEKTDLNEHPGQEFNYVLEGSMKIIIDNHELLLNEGDSVFFDASLPHGMLAVGDKCAKFLAIIF